MCYHSDALAKARLARFMLLQPMEALADLPWPGY